MPTSSSDNTAGTITAPTSSHTIQSARRNWPTAWIVLAAGLMITAAATLYLESNVERMAEQDFVSHCGGIQNTITDRLNDYARILQGGAVLFNASDRVTRKEWHIFTQTQKIEDQLPFIQGIGFSLLIPREELTRHIQEIRRTGFPEYKLKPDGDRETYSSIIYLEPFSGRNLQALGYDMFTEPVRRAAMEQARDTKSAALSGKVVLVQETSVEVQTGTLMYVPVYRKGMPTDSVEQRRAAIYGWVYSPYRMNDLMQGILAGPNLGKKQFHLQVFDGVQPSPERLLYEDHPAGDQKLWPDVRFTRQLPVDFNDHRWTLRFTQTGRGFFTMEYMSVWLTMVGGTLITFLLFSLTRVLLNTRAEAQRMVEERTTQLASMMQELSVILENAPIGIAKIIDRKQVWVNRKIKDMLQYSKEEMGAQTTRGLYPSDEVYEKIGRDAYAVLAQGLVFETEQEIMRKDGVRLLTRFIGKALNSQDMSKGVIWLVEDITERKQAEEKIRKSKQQYDNLVSKIPIGVYILHSTPEGAFTLDYVSPRMAEMFNVSVESLLADSKLVFQALHPDERDAFVTLNQTGIQQRRPFDWNGRVLVEGAVKWMHITSSPEPLENGDVLWHGIVVDITERKKAEAALKESEEKFRTVADYTYGWEVWEDPRGAWLYCSPACERITGYSPEAFMADPGLLERLIHPEDLLRWKAHHASMHSDPGTQEAVTGSANELDFRILRPDGEVRWISHLCHHIYDAEGRDLGHRITKMDITEHKLLEAEVTKGRNLESLGILAGGIAHDFNNLLQGLIGNLELAKMNADKSGKAFPFLEKAEQVSRLATKLTGKLIAFSPGGIARPIVIQPASHIREEVVSTLNGSGLVAEFDLADTLWSITVDPPQFRNVIKQMVLNAMEAMDSGSGGQLKIMAANESLPGNHGKPPTLAPGNYVRISIQDKGCGISSEHLPRIFDPYFSTKERGSQKGMGLGLALCVAIIKKHGGAITVKSSQGKGTTFHIYIPAVVR